MALVGKIRVIYVYLSCFFFNFTMQKWYLLCVLRSCYDILNISVHGCSSCSTNFIVVITSFNCTIDDDYFPLPYYVSYDVRYVWEHNKLQGNSQSLYIPFRTCSQHRLVVADSDTPGNYSFNRLPLLLGRVDDGQTVKKKKHRKRSAPNLPAHELNLCS